MPKAASLDFASIGVLRSFAAVVETGGFTSAARQLQLVPSTVSKHVATLEAGLRVALIHRTTRNLEITPAGRTFYDRCRAILEQADQAGVVAQPPSTITGELRVLASPSFTSSVLLGALPAFTGRHPQLLVDLRVGAGPVDQIREGIDVRISLDEVHRNKNPAIKLADQVCVVCASPAYLQRHGTPHTPADLRRHLGLVGHGSPYAEEWPFRVGREVRKYGVRKVLASNNGDVLRAYCLAGAGLAGLYGFHVAEDLRAGRLVEVLRPYRANPAAIHAVVQHRKYMNPATQVFIEFLREVCEGWDAGL
ncbi:MAG TPA: LysR substrate-binding domain-containing protein [Ramlibacter sp.]|nr:LysR substrate-binding domain-containing protein [Ramlibacter sp.]